MVFCKRNRSRTEAALLAAAAKLFAQKGYENTRTLDIAKLAGANEALILRYFGGKEGLLEAVLKDEGSTRSLLSSEQVKCAVEQMPLKESEVDFKKALKQFFDAGESHCEEREQFMRIAMSRALVDENMAKIMKEKVIDQQIPELMSRIGTYFKGKKHSKEEIEAYALMIAATNHVFNFMGRRIHKMNRKKVDLALSLFIDALEAAIEK